MLSQHCDRVGVTGITEPLPERLRNGRGNALGNTVKRQALVMGYSDTFAVIGFVLVLAAIAMMMLRKTNSAAGGGAH
jgi:DHA2 family multidrug resistance protein